MIDDQARILQPISPEKPCGDSLRYEGAYDRIREARQEEDARLPQGVWVTKPKAADWDFVCRTCVELLETRTKDLQIAAWLTEALVQLHGFVGLHEGLFIVLRLCERYWDCLHAGADGVDAESRSAPILWLNEKVADRLKWVPLVQTGMPADAHVNLLRFETQGATGGQANGDASATTATPESAAADLPSEVFQTDPTFYVANLDAIRGANEVCEKIEKFFASKAVVDAPSLYRVRENLHKALALLERFMARQLPLETDDLTQHGAPGVEPGSHGPSHPASSVTISSRDEAYQLLARAADFLERTEPHSPVPYLVRRAVHWGQLPLESVLPELIKGQADLDGVRELLGLKRKD